MSSILIFALGAFLAWIFDISFLQRKRLNKIEASIINMRLDSGKNHESNASCQEFHYNGYRDRNRHHDSDVEIYRHGRHGSKILQLDRCQKMPRDRVER